MSLFIGSSTLSHPSMSGTPLSPMPYVDAIDQGKHQRLIALLAAELDRTVAEIKPLYEEILKRMRNKARIDDYLPILVSKHVRRFLKK